PNAVHVPPNAVHVPPNAVHVPRKAVDVHMDSTRPPAPRERLAFSGLGRLLAVMTVCVPPAGVGEGFGWGAVR
ncbi:MAG: hypothetical protein ACKOEQ_07025, partial [Verrucomicrobiota bacterium]